MKYLVGFVVLAVALVINAYLIYLLFMSVLFSYWWLTVLVAGILAMEMIVVDRI